MHTRAVHAELLFSLEADSFLMAFSRFISLRGRPEFVLSDNGTNFRRGQKEIQAAVDRARQHESFKTIKWQFIPPHSPNWNGISERLIGSAKRALKSMIGESPRTLEELTTAFQMMAGFLNSFAIYRLSKRRNGRLVWICFLLPDLRSTGSKTLKNGIRQYPGWRIFSIRAAVTRRR